MTLGVYGVRFCVWRVPMVGGNVGFVNRRPWVRIPPLAPLPLVVAFPRQPHILCISFSSAPNISRAYPHYYPLTIFPRSQSPSQFTQRIPLDGPDVGVRITGEVDAGVPQDLLDHLQVVAQFQKERGRGMA